jgi:hypothetical protein
MKTKILFICAIAVFITGLFVSCEKKYMESVSYNANEPVFMSAEAFRASVVVTNEQHAITGSGKICFYNGYLYISEPGTGIHIIDNRKPANPNVVGFIKLPGSADLAIRNNVLYADSYSCLVWFDVSSPAKPKVEGILENVFYGVLPPIENDFGFDYDDVYSPEAQKKGIIVGWRPTYKTRTVNVDYEIMNDATVAPSNNKRSNIGVNGSMSRFGVYKNHLYVVMNNYMSIFDLSGNKPSKAVENLWIGWNVETIFSYKENLFFGTPTGLLIYSAADPLSPQYCSAISHAFGCDPVVVENDLAYVTIHSGNACGQNNNLLIVVDVKNVYEPRELASYAMTRPKGLGIDNGTLFVCDDGLKIFKADNPQTIIANQLAHYQGMDGFDVIPFDNVLMMIAEDGLYQYDYSNLGKIKELGALRFQRAK